LCNGIGKHVEGLNWRMQENAEERWASLTYILSPCAVFLHRFFLTVVTPTKHVACLFMHNSWTKVLIWVMHSTNEVARLFTVSTSLSFKAIHWRRAVTCRIRSSSSMQQNVKAEKAQLSVKYTMKLYRTADSSTHSWHRRWIDRSGHLYALAALHPEETSTGTRTVGTWIGPKPGPYASERSAHA
jgi:hypothetical protein